MAALNQDNGTEKVSSGRRDRFLKWLRHNSGINNFLFSRQLCYLRTGEEEESERCNLIFSIISVDGQAK
jgi:hypothetical protein